MIKQLKLIKIINNERLAYESTLHNIVNSKKIMSNVQEDVQVSEVGGPVLIKGNEINNGKRHMDEN